MKKNIFPIIFLFIAGCSIFGIHFKIHNPHRAGTYPKKSEARVLLGNQDSKYRTCYDVKSYNLLVSFDNDITKPHPINGSVQIVSVAASGFDTLQLDLAENMNVDSVQRFTKSRHPNIIELLPYFDNENNISKTYREKGALFVVMKNKIHAGERFSLVINYSGTPKEAKRAPWAGGFVWKKDNLGKPFDGVACETEGASLWWPCKDVMNDEPDSVDVTLFVPRGLKGVSNGVLRDTSAMHAYNSRTKKLEEKTGFHWHVSYPINIYNITFYIGNYKLLHDTYYSEITHDTLQLNHYVLEQNYDKAVTHFQQLKKYLAFYEKTFGPYPWYKDGFKLVESPYAGMEHQTAIAYGNGYKNDPQNGFDYIILHETAHEWWGNSVTANDLAEGWLHEGFATYAEALYVENTKGHQAYIDYLLKYRLFIVNRRPVVGKQGIRYFDYHDNDIYMKGAWVLHSLRYAVGNDSLFFDIIHSFYMENIMTDISSEKLEELVNRKTGKDFHWFFEQYLNNRFTPELHYYISKGNFLYFYWEKANNDFEMPVKITLNGVVQDTILPDNSRVGSLELKSNNAVIKFNDSDFLLKPVEDKNAYKLFNRQNKGVISDM